MKERFDKMIKDGLMSSDDANILMRFDKGEVSLLEVITIESRFEKYLLDADNINKINLYMGFLDLITQKKNSINKVMESGELVRIM